MLDPLILDNIKFGTSNAQDFVLIEHNNYDSEWGHDANPNWISASFVHHDEVIALRDWLNQWLNLHPAE